MRNTLLTVLLITLGVLLFAWQGPRLVEKGYEPNEKPAELPSLDANEELLTVNTTRIGSDDPIETAVAVANIVYPATEPENIPHAVILLGMDSLAEVMVAASRIQHFPVNAPILYVTPDGLPEPTRNELLRLKPEGVPADGNVQVYLVGETAAALDDEVEALNLKTRVFTAAEPAELARLVDDWTSTQHGDHRNEIVIANLDNLEPAIPSAFWNAHRGDGLAFVTDDGIPEATLEMFRLRANGPWLYVFGDETVVSEAIVRELAQYGHVTRIVGADVIETSAFFAGFHDIGKDFGAWFWMKEREMGWGIDEAGHNAIFINVEGPGGWQNAIVATTLSHMGKHAPVLVVNSDAVPPPAAEYLESTKPYPTAPQQQLTNHGLVIGGEETITWETQALLDQMLDAYLPFPEG
ncbi:MAG: cell wall-binding repeat-containing protein [Anaerolineae bacterium]|nr:cell wall-binding repeat-containing protein [Anaerolineae bacterium]